MRVDTGSPRGAGAGYNHARPQGGPTRGILKAPRTNTSGTRRGGATSAPSTAERRFQKGFTRRPGASDALARGQQVQTKRGTLNNRGVPRRQHLSGQAKGKQSTQGTRRGPSTSKPKSRSGSRKPRRK